MSVAPSFVLKASRAEKHLQDLKARIDEWAATYPYEVRTTYERKRKVRHLRFTGAIPWEVGLIAADFLHNLRSGLDQFMGALVPSNRRDSVYFPILWKGVWEDPEPGEDEKRTEDRRRWKTYTKKVRPEAVAILKSLQPPDDRGKGNILHAFRLLNLLSNRDKHQELPLTFSAVRNISLRWRDEGGRQHHGLPSTEPVMAKDGAELDFPQRAVDMEVLGTPVVAIEVSPQYGDIDVREAFDTMLKAYRGFALTPLTPYIHVSPGTHI